MAMTGPDLSKMPPNLTAAIIIALIAASVLLEATHSPNTLTIIAVLVGVIGLQQARTSQVTSRIEEQTNGKTTARFDRLEAAIERIDRRIARIEDRLEYGDRRFDEQADDISGFRKQVLGIQEQIKQLVCCERKPE